MQARTFHLSAQGASHIRRNKECQDASFSKSGEGYALAIVCDGHGGDDYVRSAIGAAYACQTAAACIETFLQDVDTALFMDREKDREELLSRLEASIISAWNTAVARHYAENPFTEDEKSLLSNRAHRRYLEEVRIESAYGTTMIAAVQTPDYWFGLQIGDGRCVVVSEDGTFLQPIPWNEKCFLNATTSICDSDAIENFRHYYAETLPAAILIGSDGVDDCFSNEAQLNQLYRTVLYSFAMSDFGRAVEELADYLPRLSGKGSGDDVSISAILDMDKIRRLNLEDTRPSANPDDKQDAMEREECVEITTEGNTDEF